MPNRSIQSLLKYELSLENAIHSELVGTMNWIIIQIKEKQKERRKETT